MKADPNDATGLTTPTLNASRSASQQHAIATAIVRPGVGKHLASSHATRLREAQLAETSSACPAAGVGVPQQQSETSSIRPAARMGVPQQQPQSQLWGSFSWYCHMQPA